MPTTPSCIRVSPDQRNSAACRQLQERENQKGDVDDNSFRWRRNTARASWWNKWSVGFLPVTSSTSSKGLSLLESPVVGTKHWHLALYRTATVRGGSGLQIRHISPSGWKWSDVNINSIETWRMLCLLATTARSHHVLLPDRFSFHYYLPSASAFGWWSPFVRFEQQQQDRWPMVEEWQQQITHHDALQTKARGMIDLKDCRSSEVLIFGTRNCFRAGENRFVI